MKKCSNCGTENESSSHFCESCGKALNNSGTTNCVNCGHEIAKGTNYCPYCGVYQQVVFGDAVEPTDEIFNGQKEEPKKVSNEETIAIVLIAVVIIAVIIISFCLIGNKKTGNPKSQDTTMVDSVSCDSVAADEFSDSVATLDAPIDSAYVVTDYDEQERADPQEEEEDVDYDVQRSDTENDTQLQYLVSDYEKVKQEYLRALNNINRQDPNTLIRIAGYSQRFDASVQSLYRYCSMKNYTNICEALDNEVEYVHNLAENVTKL